jgi:hypothetical protein
MAYVVVVGVDDGLSVRKSLISSATVSDIISSSDGVSELIKNK